MSAEESTADLTMGRTLDENATDIRARIKEVTEALRDAGIAPDAVTFAALLTITSRLGPKYCVMSAGVGYLIDTWIAESVEFVSEALAQLDPTALEAKRDALLRTALEKMPLTGKPN